jgi:hypothetical protein
MRERLVLTSGKQAERRAANNTKRLAAIQGILLTFIYYLSEKLTSHVELSQDDRNNVAAMDIDLGDAISFSEVQLGPPPGDEGFDISHEGGEHEVFEDLAQGIADLTG